MSSIWLDLDEELSCNGISKQDRFEQLKKNFGFSSKKMESERKLKSWTSVSKVSDLLDLDSYRTGIFRDRNKLWDSVIKDRTIEEAVSNTKCRLGGEHIHVSDTECDDLVIDISESARRMRDRLSRERFDLGMRNIREANKGDNSPGCSSSDSFSFPVIKRGLEDRAWSRKSSYQGNVTFPESSNASVNSDALSGKSFGRSVSINSEESVCTEKSADCSTVCETLPDGTNKTQFENNESWLTKSNSGSTICEKKVNDSTVTEENEDMMCDRSRKRTSYIERSATGSSLQEESTSERTMSCDKSGAKTVEQKMSSEIYKKAYRSPRSSSSYFDESSSNFSQHRLSKNEENRLSHGKTVSEKISKLIDEAVHQDSLFRIPLNLETDIDKMTSDFAGLKSHFTQERKKNGSRRLGRIISEDGNPDQSWSKFNELKVENEVLIQENSKLQSIIQDVTAVNKRWQKYNNERRLYVQKLLSTIQDLQEQINFISEKSAFQSSHKENFFEDAEKLKREFQERKTVLELQIKSHKDDWEAERKEKQKLLLEKEDLEKRLKELSKETNFLKDALFEEKRIHALCSSCKNILDKGAVFPRNEFFPSNTFMPNPAHKSLHDPYKMLSSGDSHFSRDFLPEESNGRQSYYTSTSKESSFNERFSDSFSQCNKASGDTIVVEDENGLRLSITEQFPSKDSQMKSILKKTDKKLKRLTTEGKKTGKSRRSSGDERKLVCNQSCQMSINFEKEHSPLTSYSPYCIPEIREYEYPVPNPELLKVTADNRSKSEPNTRSNSSENLKPLRESSSWNSQCLTSNGELNRSDCDPSFSPSMPPKFVNRYENPSKQDHF